VLTIVSAYQSGALELSVLDRTTGLELKGVASDRRLR
jgi:hypothetical protein